MEMLSTKVIKDIKMTEEEISKVLVDLFEQNSIVGTKSNVNDKLISYDLINEASVGMIKLYKKKDGSITLDGSSKFGAINQLIISQFNKVYNEEKNTTNECINKCAVYNIKNDDITEIKEYLKDIEKKNNYNVEPKFDLPNYIVYQDTIYDNVLGEKAVVTQYKSGKLTVQGKTWGVWDELCYSIDRKIDVNASEMYERLVSKQYEYNVVELRGYEEVACTSAIGEEQNEYNVTLSRNGEIQIIERLGEELYDFLYDHDKALVTSSQSLLISKIDTGDYYCYVAPMLRVIDGLLKKFLIHLNISTETKINDSKFNYGQVFDGLNGLQDNGRNVIIATKVNADDVEVALLKLYKLFKDTRNPLQHDGPPIVKMVPTYDDAESEIDDIIVTFKETYKIIFKVE